MSGGPDPLYVRARSALLDAAEALAEQLDAVVLVGAQAVYLHTGDADFATAEYTTDADFCVAPAELHGMPLPTEITGSTRGPRQAASRVTSAVTHIGETECMHRPVPGARLLHRSQVPATGSSPGRTLRHCNDVQERRDARCTSELRIVCQHRRRSLSPVSPVRVHDQHDQVGIAYVDVAATRCGLQNEADG